MAKEKKTIVSSPFIAVPADIHGQSNFDTEYISIQIVDYVEKTGDGENDFVVKKKVIEDRTPIDEVVQADARSVGVYNLMERMLTKDQYADDGRCNVDLVGAPENLMEVKQLAIDAENKFASLPQELVGDMDMNKFVESMSQEKFDQFVNALIARQEKKGDNGNE